MIYADEEDLLENVPDALAFGSYPCVLAPTSIKQMEFPLYPLKYERTEDLIERRSLNFGNEVEPGGIRNEHAYTAFTLSFDWVPDYYLIYLWRFYTRVTLGAFYPFYIFRYHTMIWDLIPGSREELFQDLHPMFRLDRDVPQIEIHSCRAVSFKLRIINLKGEETPGDNGADIQWQEF